MDPQCHMGPRCFGRQRANEGQFLGQQNQLPVCWTCREHFRWEIGALPRDYVDLTNSLSRARAGARADIKRPKPKSSPPIDLAVETLRSDIHWVLTCWEPVVREAAQLSPERTRGVRMGVAVQIAARLIAAHVDLLISTPLTWSYTDGLEAGPVEADGMYAVGQLRSLHRTAMGALGLIEPVVSLAGHCPRCGAAGLRRREGGDVVWCGPCGQRLTEQQYREVIDLLLTAV